MKKANIIASVLFAVFSIVFIIYTVDTLPAGRQGVPGPGVFPIIVAGVMLLCSLSILITYIKSKDTTPIDLFSEGPRRAYLAMGVMVIYLVLAPIIGFLVVTFAFSVGTIKWFSKRGLLYVAAVSLGITVFVHITFSVILNVPLPTGFLI